MRRCLTLVLTTLFFAGFGGVHDFSATLAQTPAPQEQTVELPDHVPAALQQATKLTRTGAGAPAPAAATQQQPLTLTFVLNRTDEAGFQAYLKSVSTPGPHAFLTQDQLAAQFGPSQQAYDALLAHLQTHGFSLVQGSSNRLTLTVQASRGQVEQALHTQIDDYQLGTRHFHANSTNPAVEASVAPYVHAIAGLSNLAQPQAAPATAPAGTKSPLVAPGGADNGSPMAMASAYDFGPLGVNGSGQQIGLAEFDNFSSSDVSNWLSYEHLPSTLINQVHTTNVNGGTPASGGGGTTETLLDIDTALGMAQGANITVYDAGGSTSFQTMFNAMIAGGATVISNSWFFCEPDDVASDLQSIDSVIAQAQASGIAVYTATGDSGATCNDGSYNGTAAAVPADSPNATGVGGTSLQVTDASSNAYQSETFWNDSAGSGGYATSTVFNAPSWQSGLAGSMRSLPDVSADGDPYTGIRLCQGSCPTGYVYGGTSMAAPEWAAGTALLNQKLGYLVGNLNQTLYGLTGAGQKPFHSAASMSSTFTKNGIGSFDLNNLEAALTGSTPAAKPVPPTQVSAQSGNQSATVSWVASPSAGVTGYTVTAYGPNGTALPPTVSALASATTAVISQGNSGPPLTNGTAYTFTVHTNAGAVSSVESSPAGPVTPAPPAAPGAPTGVTAVPGNQQATVSWTAPASNNSPIQSYTVTPYIGATAQTAVVVNPPVTAQIVPNLTNGTAYTFKVSATNGIGSGPLSAASNAVTPAMVPAAPTNVSAVAGDGQATVSWTDPANGGSAITSYTATTTSGGFKATVNGASATSVVVTGLTDGVQYSFTVHATNAVGNSAESSPASNAVTPSGPCINPTLGLNGSPATVVVGTKVTLTAGVSACATPDFEWWQGQAGHWTIVSSYAANVNPFIWDTTGLTPGTYYVGYWAENVGGDPTTSDVSTTDTFTVTVGAPGAPTDVSAVPGNQQATVSWTDPAGNGGSAITSYTATSTPGNFTGTVSGANATSVVVSGLANGTAYTFTVHATNAIGKSVESSPASSPVTPLSLPGAPTGVSAVPGNQQATVSWTAASNGGSLIQSYTVTPYIGASAQTPTTFNLTATTQVVPNLANGTAYTFTVYATNGFGPGPASAASSAVTPATVPGAPTGVSAVAGAEQATVSWADPASNGGSAITSYTATSTPGNFTGTVNGANATSLVVSGLANSTEYTFTVHATNAIGNSAESAPISNAVTPSGPPEPCGNPTLGLNGSPSTVASGTNVTLTAGVSSCGAPDFEWWQGQVVGGAGHWTIVSSYAANVNPFTWDTAGLTPGTYYVGYWAENVGGDQSTNDTSDTDTFTVTGAVPGAPTGVSAVAGAGQATVSWTDPASNGGSGITSYTATSSPGGIKGTVSGATATSVVVSGLANSTSYTFTVHATNANGNSVESSPPSAPVTTAAGPPQPCSNPTLGSNGSPSTVAAGTNVTLTAGVSSCATPDFEWWQGQVVGSAVHWSTVSAYAANVNPFIWNTTGLTPGTYYVGYWAENVGGDPSTNDVSTTDSFTVTAVGAAPAAVAMAAAQNASLAGPNAPAPAVRHGTQASAVSPGWAIDQLFAWWRGLSDWAEGTSRG